MDQRTVADDSTLPKFRHRTWLVRVACGTMLWVCWASAHAASVYRCLDAHGHLAFQDTPCAGHAQQRELDLDPQPLIGAPGEAAARIEATSAIHPRQRQRRRKVSAHASRAKPVMSWECRAADGEVFYRHTRCPGSVPGDGVVRSRYVEKMSSAHSRSHHNAWSPVRVHGVKISRSEACRRIHAAGAAGRDGHQRDETVSTYDHLIGRDPCTGA